MENNLYTSKEIAELINVSKRTVVRRAEILKLNHTGRKFRFDETDFNLIKNYERTNASKKVAVTSSKILLYYPLKTTVTEVFYIYQSSMNN